MPRPAEILTHPARDTLAPDPMLGLFGRPDLGAGCPSYFFTPNGVKQYMPEQ